MSQGERIFLNGGKTEYESGSSINLESFLPNEKKLDEKLWHDPEAAGKDIKYLLETKGGYMTPQLSRLALKGISLSLFVREAKGGEVNEDTEEDIQHIALRSAIVLQNYLRILDDPEHYPDVDQRILNQAINETVLVGLTARTFGSLDPDLDDVIVLPTTPLKEYPNEPTQFTVLLRKSLGRAKLIIATIDKAQQPGLNDPDMIYIRPSELTGPKLNMQRLARTLVAEQQLELLSKISTDLLAHATSQLYSKIYGHFDTSTKQK